MGSGYETALIRDVPGTRKENGKPHTGLLRMIRIMEILDMLVLSSVRIFLYGILLTGIWCLYENNVILRDAGPEKVLWTYRPDPATGQTQGLESLCLINPDVKGWITVPGTMIDYPILQGEDNVRYVNTNVYGEFSVSGSIFLDSRCAGDFTDPYSLVYGHHMEGGRMFAGLEDFMDPDYLAEHQEAVLSMTERISWRIHIFACMNADGYDTRWYDPHYYDQAGIQELVQGILQNSDASVKVPCIPEEDTRILALSTCAAEGTNRRILVFAYFTSADQIPCEDQINREDPSDRKGQAGRENRIDHEEETSQEVDEY